MKKLVLIPILTLLVLAGCEEIPPGVDMTVPTLDLFDSTYVAAVEAQDPKVVVLEEFTGVHCTPCVNGHIKAKQLQDDNPGRVVVVGYHNGALSWPYDGDEDLRTTQGRTIHDKFNVNTWPTGLIDRKLYSGEASVGVSWGQWETYTTQQLAVTAPVNVRITPSIVSPTSGVFHLVCRVEAAFTQTVTEPLSITVGVMEDHIIAEQSTSSGSDPNYEQNHVFRAMLSPATGSSISSTTEAGRVIVQEFAVENIPGYWDLDNCEVFAFIHERGTTDEVLQGVVAPVN